MRLLTLLLLASTVIFADAPEGGALYRACAKCHGDAGEKTTFSRPIGGWNEQELRKALGGYRAGTRNLRGQGSIMRQRLSGYSDAQLDALAKYVSKLH